MESLKFFDQIMHKIGEYGLPPLNMQGACVVDPRHSKSKITAAILAEHIAARLRNFDILRKKLVQDPLMLGDIKLVDDPDFDIFDHITFRTLPRPGDFRTLSRAIGEFSAEPLDNSKAPWRIEIIDGLEDGKFCIAQKLSHATMDGLAAIKVFQSLYDSKPLKPDKYAPREWVPQKEPSRVGLLSGAVKDSVYRLVVHYPKALGELARFVSETTNQSLKRRLDLKEKGADSDAVTMFKAPTTSLNQAISANERVIAFANYDLNKLKSLGEKLDCTLNDLCLVMVSESLSGYFKGIGETVDGDLVVAMPMSKRSEGGRSHGNEVTAVRVKVHNTLADLPDRLRAIQAQTSDAKSSLLKSMEKNLQFDEVLATLSPLLIDLILVLVARLQPWDKMPTFINAAVSNMPGPKDAMYIAGMPMECSIPMIPINHLGALSIGATSAGNIFSFGFHACGRIVREENLHYLIEGLNKAYVDLQYFAEKGKSPPAGRRTPRTVDALVASSVSQLAVKKKPARSSRQVS